MIYAYNKNRQVGFNTYQALLEHAMPFSYIYQVRKSFNKGLATLRALSVTYLLSVKNIQ